MISWVFKTYASLEIARHRQFEDATCAMDGKPIEQVIGKKRAADEEDEKPVKKQRPDEAQNVKDRFRHDLFDDSVLEGYTKAYSQSQP